MAGCSLLVRCTFRSGCGYLLLFLLSPFLLLSPLLFLSIYTNTQIHPSAIPDISQPSLTQLPRFSRKHLDFA